MQLGTGTGWGCGTFVGLRADFLSLVHPEKKQKSQCKKTSGFHYRCFSSVFFLKYESAGICADASNTTACFLSAN